MKNPKSLVFVFNSKVPSSKTTNFFTILIKVGSEEAFIEFTQAIELAPQWISGHLSTKSEASSIGFSYLKNLIIQNNSSIILYNIYYI